MLGSDDTLFSLTKENNQTILRLSHYLDALRESNPTSRIIDIVHTRFSAESFSPINGIEIIPIQSKYIQCFPWMGFKYVRKEIANSNMGLITCQNPFEVGLLGVLLKRKLKIPLEVQIHLNFFSPYWTKEHNLYNRIRYFMAKMVVRNADKIRVVSSSIQDALIERWDLPASKIYLAPVPVYITNDFIEKTNISISFKPDKRVILYIGRLAYQKNLYGFFEICQRVLSLFNDVEVVIIGEGPLKNYVEDKISEIHTNRIHLLGAIPYSELSHWYKQADIFLLPSYYEGLPRVLIESYLFNVPTVGSSCAGLQDIILDGQTGFLVDVENIDAFVEKISWILNHPKEKKEMGIKGCEFVRSKFAPFLLTKKIVSEWVQLVNNYESNLDYS